MKMLRIYDILDILCSLYQTRRKNSLIHKGEQGLKRTKIREIVLFCLFFI